MRWSVFTAGVKNPSARFRIRYLKKRLSEVNIELKEYPARFSSFPPRYKLLRPFWGLAILLERLLQLVDAKIYSDVVIFQRELISTLYTFEGLFKWKYSIFDVDDAIWLYKNGIAFEKIASAVDLVVCGNSYIADRANLFNENIETICTPIDLNKYAPKDRDLLAKKQNKIIGWIGSSSGYAFFSDSIQKQIEDFLIENHGWILHIVSDAPPDFSFIDKKHVKFTKWSEQIELDSIQSFSIGLMPIADDAWGRGKCSFKLLQYMACGVPSICSSVGMNNEVLSDDSYGFAIVEQGWHDSLSKLLHDDKIYLDIAIKGRERVAELYSTSSAIEKWLSIVKKITND